MMPRFFKDFPASKTGEYKLSVIRTNPFNAGRVVWEKTVRGNLRKAYLLVRLHAFLEDLITPFYDGEIGIDWQINCINENI